MECLFCKIVKGEIPSYKLYEDDACIVVLDINPVKKGHCLIIPKKHYRIFLTIPIQELKHLMEISYYLKKFLEKKLGYEFIIFVANGTSAGQKIDHAHIQLIPKNPVFDLVNDTNNDMSLAESIRQYLNKFSS